MLLEELLLMGQVKKAPPRMLMQNTTSLSWSASSQDSEQQIHDLEPLVPLSLLGHRSAADRLFEPTQQQHQQHDQRYRAQHRHQLFQQQQEQQQQQQAHQQSSDQEKCSSLARGHGTRRSKPQCSTVSLGIRIRSGVSSRAVLFPGRLERQFVSHDEDKGRGSEAELNQDD
jgi:hypothetical protein